MRIALLPAAVALSVAVQFVVTTSQAFASEPEVVAGDWLAIEGVDARGRAPFNPDALLGRYLLDPDATSPVAGESVTGSRGEPQAWATVSADEKGQVGGGIALAYRAYESAAERIVLADLPGGSALVVNGVPYVGDVYRGGFGPTPVALRQGTNHLYVRGVRGAFRLTFTTPGGPLVLTGRDSTVPDVVGGEPAMAGLAAVVLANCTTEWIDILRVETDGATSAQPFRVAPLGLLKVPVPLAAGKAYEGETGTNVSVGVRVHATRGAPGEIPFVVAGAIDLPVRTAGDVRVLTFESALDGSVQEYAVRYPSSPSANRIVLSVHGAGVGCRGQASAYSAKKDAWVVAATNRRPFGFDWQDWGRADAYEVLAHALEWTSAERDTVCLTGHSMGGHGTWHLGANDPDGWAAIAPSAGWSQFDNYGGRPDQARREPWYGADAASDTLALLDNLVQLPTFVLHGTADDNVPIEEAERMVSALRLAGGAPQAHFQQGAGHWWNGDVAAGADCVDWPGIFDLFAASRIADAPRRIRWTTVDPAVDAEHHWVRVEQPVEYGRRVRVEGSWNPDSGEVLLTTENAGLLRIEWPGEGGLRRVVIDDVALLLDAPRDQLWLRRGGSVWWAVDGPAPGEKTAAVSGPFKRGFGNRFVLVTGTAGSPEETSALLERARYDALSWRYRGNGLAEIVTDRDLLVGAGFAGRNVILYGNSDSNAAWDSLIGDDSPIVAARGEMTLGDQTWGRDDLAAVFVRPRADDPSSLVACFADTGPAGTRLHAALLTFVSGVGYPDYAVFGPEVLTAADDGVLAAGWFNPRWTLRPGRN